MMRESAQYSIVAGLAAGDLFEFGSRTPAERYLVMRDATIEDEIDGDYGLPGDKICLVLYDDERPSRVVLMHRGWWVNVLVRQ